MLNAYRDFRETDQRRSVLAPDIYTPDSVAYELGEGGSSFLSDHLVKRFGNPNQTLIVRVTRSIPKWLDKARNDLNALLNLPGNWDGAGAVPLQLQAATTALRLMSPFMSDDCPFPAIVPTNVGGLQLEWHRRGVDLELRIEPTGQASYFFEDLKSGESQEHIVGSNLMDMRGVLSAVLVSD